MPSRDELAAAMTEALSGPADSSHRGLSEVERGRHEFENRVRVRAREIERGMWAGVDHAGRYLIDAGLTARQAEAQARAEMETQTRERHASEYARRQAEGVRIQAERQSVAGIRERRRGRSDTAPAEYKGDPANRPDPVLETLIDRYVNGRRGRREENNDG